MKNRERYPDNWEEIALQVKGLISLMVIIRVSTKLISLYLNTLII